MNVLVVGSGGREHAIAWKLAQSSRLQHLWIAPGNPGTALLGQNIAISELDVPALVEFSQKHSVDLVVIGPEAALAAGLTDALASAGIAVFGPTQAAARIETSKAFAKQFMQRCGIPTARFAIFDRLEPALRHVEEVDYPIVIKASGLAGGKGVLLPNGKQEARANLRDIFVDHRFGQAGAQIVIEERLFGEEISLLAFTDGLTLSTMPPAQDHKRLLEDDLGENTGGMGSFAPTPLCPPSLQAAITRDILQPALDGLRAEGVPFVGVLYAGLILTPQGPRVLEFNARFGDPETQSLLPLLETDLLDILLACTCRRLAAVPVRWKESSAVCVVMASSGYPQKAALPTPIHGLPAFSPYELVFQAGTEMRDGRLMATGGRVLGVTAEAPDLPRTVEAAYKAVARIHYDGAHYRKDIARKALLPVRPRPASLYTQAGVDIDAGNRTVDMIRAAVSSTYDSRVLAGIGAFGGLFDAGGLKTMDRPVMVASTDGVGTKVKLAAALGRYRGVGIDIVNHCIDDILVQGARPLFFLDYFASSTLQPRIVAEVVSGIAEACRAAGCVLLGGETAEMPSVYQSGEFDIAGTIVGCAERDRLLPRQDIRPGDCLIGLRSVGPHTNGYSLLRKIFEDADLNAFMPELGETLADALLAPHRSYLDLLMPLIGHPASPIKALAHITGGGFIENIPRVLAPALGVRVHLGSWPVPPLFRLVQQCGNVSEAEMYRVFNMGIGMVAVVDPCDVPAFRSAIPEPTWVIGEVALDPGHKVRLV